MYKLLNIFCVEPFKISCNATLCVHQIYTEACDNESV